MFEGVDMDVIHMAAVILLIPDPVFPIMALPDAAFPMVYRSSYHLTPASNRCLVYATLVRTSFGINFRPFLNMR